jgi:preprotein translocase subunit SecY
LNQIEHEQVFEENGTLATATAKQMNELGRSLATAKQLPVVLDKIITELVMSGGIFNIPMCLEKSLKKIGVPLRSNSGTNIVIMESVTPSHHRVSCCVE